jgi:Zinc carboxypeptidase/Carboxypeptidase regulatory-like domain/Dockerin type I domain
MMRILSVILLAAFILSFATTQARPIETYFKFEISNRAELDKLTRVISIDNVKGNTVFAYANEDELSMFESLGYTYEILQHPGTLIDPAMSTDKSGLKDWDTYPTYDAYVAMMQQFAIDYPSLCEVTTIGYSVEGREIIYIKISDNVSIEEDEPEVMYSSSMHGDELTGYVLTLRLIDSLLVSYGTDSLITRLVDSCEIWINPLANPDGTFAGGNSSVYGATRSNANGYDLNRNFPDPEDGPNPGGTRQQETTIMMDFAELHTFVISANFHGGAEVINYPWDTWYPVHVDDVHLEAISRQYADSAQYYSPSGYMTDQDNGITNGAAWYSISGGRQDYMTYFHQCREVTNEISGTKLIAASQLPAHWNYNRIALLNWLEEGLFGIRGIVTDNSTGLPLHAMIRLLGHDTDHDSSMVFTDPDVGDYHRMINPGTYDVEFSAPGYFSDTVTSVVVTSQQSIRVDVALVPLPNEPVLGFGGHNGGIIDPGDTVSMNITLINYGAGIAYNTVGTLSEDDPYLNVLQSTSTYPNIGTLGGSEESNSLYQFEVLSSCPLDYITELRLDVIADGGYVDSFFFDITIGLLIESFENGDFSALPWEMSGIADWTIVSDEVYDGIYASKSGSISHNQASEMSLTASVTSNANISFYYKVSSESGYDTLKFYIDNDLMGHWSGTAGWAEVSYPVTVGSRTFKWRYAKDGNTSNGSDCGWIDKITFPSMVIIPEISTLSLPDWTQAAFYSEQLEASGGMGTLTWSDKNGDLFGTGLNISATGVVSGIPLGTGTITFTAVVTDGNSQTDEREFSFDINASPEITSTAVPDWTEGKSYAYQLQATGGTGSLLWSDRDSELVGSGLALSSTGLLSGLPTDDGAIHFIAKIVDHATASDEHEFNFVINQTISILTESLPDGIIDEPYSFQLESEGGTGSKIWSDRYNSLNGSGLSLSEEGLISGTPLESGLIGFYAEVEDITGSNVYKPLSFDIKSGYICGDANSDEDVNVSDAVFIINYVFIGGDTPDPIESGDANCDEDTNVSDAVWIINFVFIGGDIPCDTDGDSEPDC